MASKNPPKKKAAPAKRSAAKAKKKLAAAAAPPPAAGRQAIEVRITNALVGMRYPLPEYATEGAAGMDLRACLDYERIIMPGDTLLVTTGIAVNIADPSIMGVLAPRSGLASQGRIILANQVGVIDSDYQGEIKVPLWNAGEEPYELTPGERIAQLMFVPVRRFDIELVEEFSTKTARGSGGFGHTGTH